MRHSRLFLFLGWLLVAIISGTFWGLTQLLPEATHTALNQTLQTLGVSDVALVYTIVSIVFVVSLIIIVVMVAVFLADRKKAEPLESLTQYPQVAVEYAQEDSQMFKQLEVQLNDRREPIKAHFEFVTITNLTGPTIDGMEAEFRVSNVVSRKALHPHGPLVFVFSTHSDHLTIHHEDDMGMDEFRKLYGVAEHFEAEVASTNDGRLASRTMMLHKGKAKTVGIALTLEDSDKVFIPNYQTRSWVFMPCSFDIELFFFGNPALSPEPVRFHVQAKDWKSLRVVDSEVHMKLQQERMRLVYGPLYSAAASMREGKDAVPRGYTVGTPINAWTKYPEIMQRIIDIFSHYPDLVENDGVWNGWARKESELRKREFWLGGEVYEWFDAIEEEYRQIDSELKARSSSS